ncbi:MAG: ABC transporter substrate-binding protein, partial [Gammaproteobacteria bacterium]|nr:ABC transporter substrate-binding protein [Gammaproteobacteria bacterium]
VSDYLKQHGKYPSFYGAQSYDAIMLIKSAVEATGGNLKDKDAVRKALMAADYDSVRGRYTYGNNHMPIQNFYLREVVEDSEGRWTTKIVKTVYENHQDLHASKCKM